MEKKKKIADGIKWIEVIYRIVIYLMHSREIFLKLRYIFMFIMWSIEFYSFLSYNNACTESERKADREKTGTNGKMNEKSSERAGKGWND